MSYFWKMSQYNLTFDLKMNLGHSDLYFMVQWFLFFIFCSEKHFSFIGKARFRRATLSCDSSYFLCDNGSTLSNKKHLKYCYLPYSAYFTPCYVHDNPKLPTQPLRHIFCKKWLQKYSCFDFDIFIHSCGPYLYNSWMLSCWYSITSVT